ncbi:unnamed protein product [Caenorhabditis brenneri]
MDGNNDANKEMLKIAFPNEDPEELDRIFQTMREMHINESGPTGSAQPQHPNTMEFGGLQSELDSIQRQQMEAILRLEQAAQNPRDQYGRTLPLPICNVLGTWTATPAPEPINVQDVLPAAFQHKYIWFKHENQALHYCVFTGLNQVNYVESFRYQPRSSELSTEWYKIISVKADRIEILHQNRATDVEEAKVEILVEDNKLYFIFVVSGRTYVKEYQRSFRRY